MQGELAVMARYGYASLPQIQKIQQNNKSCLISPCVQTISLKYTNKTKLWEVRKTRTWD